MSDQLQRPSQSYRDLIAWLKAMRLGKCIYRLNTMFTAEEKIGVTFPMARAAVSVPPNFAEGQARRTVGEFVQFISHAEGSVAELDTQLTLSTELEFCSELDAREAEGLIQELRKMLNALRRSVSAHNS